MAFVRMCTSQQHMEVQGGLTFQRTYTCLKVAVTCSNNLKWMVLSWKLAVEVQTFYWSSVVYIGFTSIPEFVAHFCLAVAIYILSAFKKCLFDELHFL